MLTCTSTKLRTLLNLFNAHKTKKYKVGINVLSNENSQAQRGKEYSWAHTFLPKSFWILILSM